MFRRALAIAMVFALAISAMIGTVGAAAPSPASGSIDATSTVPTSSVTPTISAPPAATPAPVAPKPAAKPKPKAKAKKAPRYPLPAFKKGAKRSAIRKALRKRTFRATYRYTYGKKNHLVRRVKVARTWKAKRRYSRRIHRYVYPQHTMVIVTLGNGKKRPRPRHWRTGIATWYSIADNTPAGSRATSSGKPLGSFGGFTFATRNFPLGTKLLIKRGSRQHVVVCTDRGGLETIDLYKPASDYFGMNGKSSFKYAVIRRGW